MKRLVVMTPLVGYSAYLPTRLMKEGGSLQTLDLGFSSASVYGGDTVTAVELELYELFV